MSGSSFGTIFQITTWGESHGKAYGVVIDGAPSNLPLTENDFTAQMNRRRPGNPLVATSRVEADEIEILSGTYNGITTGAPISLLIHNTNTRSKDYSELEHTFRPGHADYSFWQKYGYRDPRGGGRSSGRETVSRVAAGVIAQKILSELGVSFISYTSSIGPITVPDTMKYPDMNEVLSNPTCMPTRELNDKALEYISKIREGGNSTGGSICCIAKGFPVGVGNPVFDKLDAKIAQAMMSIGAVKAVEIGDGTKASSATGLMNNDPFTANENHEIFTKSNHCGGILGGISTGGDIIVKVHVKPTPSISALQDTVNEQGDFVSLSIMGRHDPVIVPRAVVVVESMLAITLTDALFQSFCCDMNKLKSFYRNN